MRKSYSALTVTRHPKENKSKATSSLSSSARCLQSKKGHNVIRTKTQTLALTPQQWEVHKTINQQQQNHRLRTDSSLSYGGGGGLNAFERRQTFTLVFIVVKARHISTPNTFTSNITHPSSSKHPLPCIR